MKDEVESKKWECIGRIVFTLILLVAQIVYAGIALPMIVGIDTPNRQKQQLIFSFFVLLVFDVKSVLMCSESIAGYRDAKVAFSEEVSGRTRGELMALSLLRSVEQGKRPEIPFSSKDWLDCLKVLKDNKCLSLVLALRKPDSAEETPIAVNEFRIKQRAAVDKQLALAAYVSKILGDEGIKCVVLKGARLSLSLWGTVYARTSGDVDILVAERDVGKADFILKEKGFMQVIAHEMRRAKDASQRASIMQPEFPLFPKNDSKETVPYYCYDLFGDIPVDLHIGFHYLKTETINEVLETAEEVTINKQRFLVPSKAKQTVLLIANLFENTESVFSNIRGDKACLRDYCDLAAAFKAIGGSSEKKLVINEIKNSEIERETRIVCEGLHYVFPNSPDLDWVLKAFGGEPDPWGISPLDRCLRPEMCKTNARCVLRNSFRECNQGWIRVLPYQNREQPLGDCGNIDGFKVLSGCSIEGVKGLITIWQSGKRIITYWTLPEEQIRDESKAFTLTFYLTGNDEAPFQGTIYFRWKRESLEVCYSCSDGLFQKPIFRKKGYSELLDVKVEQTSPDWKISIGLPASLLFVDDPCDIRASVCAAAYKHIHGDVYHRVSKDDAERLNPTPLLFT